MKRIIILCLLLSLLLASATTPEEEFVKNKADGSLEDLIHASSSPSEQALIFAEADEKSPLYAQLVASERFTMEPETRAVPFSNRTVSADAAVVLSNVNAIPVYVASGKNIPNERLEAIAQTR